MCEVRRVKQLKTCCFICDSINNKLLQFEENNPYCTKFKLQLRERIILLIEDLSVTHFISGMNIGIEQYAAEVILDLKSLYPQITLEGVLPFENQAVNWTEYQRDKYFFIMKESDKETLLQYRYTNDCMGNSDLYMVSKSKFIITVCNKSKTSRIGKLISYAKSTGKVVFIIDSDTLDIKPNIRICK